MRILVVEDEPRIAADIRSGLEAANYVVDTSRDGDDAWFKGETEDYDAIVLDLGLPRLDGLTVLKRLRDAGVATPVLILTARDGWREKVDGIDAGADDYLTKPFGIGELLARVRANLRRPRPVASGDGEPPDAVFRFGDVEVDQRARIVRRGGVEVHLTPMEYRLLSVLAANTGRVLTHRQLLREVWGPSHAEQNHYLRIYMGHLRQKLEADPAQPRHLLTETAVGYRLVQGG
jgi:two-component system, OmpR family, KDP operon response regulator KdpE